MLDYLESKLARREYEERVLATTRIKDVDAELNRTAGYWQARPIGALLLSFGQGVTAFAARFIHQPARDGTAIELDGSAAQAGTEMLEWEAE